MKCEACKVEHKRIDLNQIEVKVEGEPKWHAELCDDCKKLFDQKLEEVKRFCVER